MKTWQEPTELSTERRNYAASFFVGVRFIGPQKGLINQAPTKANTKFAPTQEPAAYLWRVVLRNLGRHQHLSGPGRKRAVHAAAEP